MADTVERTIYRIELDDSAYTQGVDRAAASTKKLTDSQAAANKTLQTNEAALKANTDLLQKSKKDLDDYTGSNERYRKQLEKSFQSAQADQTKLTQLVADNKKRYDEATAAAEKFAAVSSRATQLQQQTTGGRIPVAPPVFSAASAPAQIASIINTEDFGNQILIIEQTKKEFDALRISIDLAEARMKQLNATDEEFQRLEPIVKQGRIALEQYDKAAAEAAGDTTSLRGQLRLAREELVKLEQAGKAGSKAYIELELRTAKLTDAINDQSQRIKILASDTRLLDFGKAAITGATSAFSAYTSISILAGDQSEELQKKTMQLFAAMQLLTSLEQLSNLVRREGIIGLNVMAAAQATYTAVVGASTGALKAFRIALLTSGIGAAIALIGFLAYKFSQAKDEVEKLSEAQQNYRKVQEEAAKSVAKDVTQLEVYRSRINDINLTTKQRNIAVDEYNKVADKSNQIDKDQINNTEVVNGLIDRQTQLLLKRGLARAAETVIAEKAEAFLLALERTNLSSIEEVNKKILELNNATQQTISETTTAAQARAIQKTKEQGTLQKILLAGAQVAFTDLQNTIKTFQSIINDPAAIVPGKGKEIENVFIQERDKLLARLADLRNTEAQTIKKINDEFAAKLIVEQNRINDLVTQGKVTKDQGFKLFDIAKQVNQTELDKALTDFNKKVTDARKKLNEELSEIQNKNSLDTVNLLQDEFNKRAALIELNEKQELQNAEDNTTKRIESLELERLLIGEQQYQFAKNVIVEQGEQQTVNIVARFAQERQALSADIFQQSLASFRAFTNNVQTGADTETAAAIRKQSDRFLSGKINFEQFQKALTKIQRDAEAERRNLSLINERTELDVLDRRLAKITDRQSKEAKDLQKQRDDQAAKIVAAEKEDAIKDAEDKNADPDKRKIETLSEYVTAVGQLSEAVIGFWQRANEAESAALDRSIALQEKRVDAAQRIAERGNASYLKAEEDRLRELQVARENAARRELAINAALQASQLLVGITGAIAKIATPGIGIAETIGAIATIFAALATGYGLVKSLQGNQPRLAKGTKNLQRNGHPPGVDTIPALLNEGEAVIPTEKNRAYHPAVAAIYDGTIPAEDMNQFVKNYHSIKKAPQPNYDRIKQAADVHISSDGKLALLLTENNKKLDESNMLSRQTLRAMKNMSVSATVDKNGVAIMVNEFMLQQEIDKKS